MRAKILVIDDKPNMRSLFSRLLGQAHDVSVATEGAQGLELLNRQLFDVVVTDVRMPGIDGFEVLESAKRIQPDVEVVMVTAYATVSSAVEAIKHGAYDYIEKPFDPDAAVLVIERAIERKRLREQAASLQRELAERFSFHSIIGGSPVMQRLFTLLERAARTDITVLLTGESGTGKELAARAIHFESARSHRPFVPVNCGALPGELIESELFGHARGAFTGAGAARPGLFEEARGGTLFLDEIGELPLSAQVKLNRVLQEHEVRRVGENTTTHIDVRVIAATNRDLRAEVQKGTFREDLYYRLNVFTIEVPPLRSRGDDIRLLATHFLAKSAERLSLSVERFEPEAMRQMLSYAWPGNVRELENAVERAVAIAPSDRIRPEDLPRELAQEPARPQPVSYLVDLGYRDAMKSAREDASRVYLEGLMDRFGGNVTQAAEHAGVERESLHRLLRKHGIRTDDFRDGEHAH